MLENMGTAEQRLETLSSIRRMTRVREQYWLGIYVNKLVRASPRTELDCVVYGQFYEANVSAGSMTAAAGGDGEGGGGGADDEDGGGDGGGNGSLTAPAGQIAVPGVYEALILQLGSFYRYKLFSPPREEPVLQPGMMLRCALLPLKSGTNPFLLLPMDVLQRLNGLPSDKVENALKEMEMPAAIRKDFLAANRDLLLQSSSSSSSSSSPGAEE